MTQLPADFLRDSNSLIDNIFADLWKQVAMKTLLARDSLRTFCAAGKDVLYEAMNREDWNWRALQSRLEAA